MNISSIGIDINKDCFKEMSMEITVKVTGIWFFRLKWLIIRGLLKIMGFIAQPMTIRPTIKRNYKYKIKGNKIVVGSGSKG